MLVSNAACYEQKPISVSVHRENKIIHLGLCPIISYYYWIVVLGIWNQWTASVHRVHSRKYLINNPKWWKFAINDGKSIGVCLSFVQQNPNDSSYSVVGKTLAFEFIRDFHFYQSDSIEAKHFVWNLKISPQQTHWFLFCCWISHVIIQNIYSNKWCMQKAWIIIGHIAIAQKGTKRRTSHKHLTQIE